MNTVEDSIEAMVTMLQKLDGAPALFLVFVSCLVVGYALKTVKSFPNQAIPLVVILWGSIVNPIIADAMNDTPLRIWMIRNVLVGSITGFVAWMAHASVLSRVEDRFGLFTKPKNTNHENAQTPAPTPPAP